MNVIKESFDVHGEEGGCKFFLFCHLDVVKEGNDGDVTGRMGSSSELFEGGKVERSEVVY